MTTYTHFGYLVIALLPFLPIIALLALLALLIWLEDKLRELRAEIEGLKK